MNILKKGTHGGEKGYGDNGERMEIKGQRMKKGEKKYLDNGGEKEYREEMEVLEKGTHGEEN